MTSNDSDATFVRRKFTITESLDSVLIEMAAQNYQGNVSLCIRAAIEDHRSTLDRTGSNSLTTQRLEMKLEGIKQQQKIISSTLGSIQDQLEEQDHVEQETGRDQRNGGGMTDDMQLIYDEVEASDSGLRVDDLGERLDMPLSRLQLALGSLVDLGHVVDIGEKSHRFQLTGYTSNNAVGEIQ